eukprot:TRINITY_DN5243_c0_g1_i1.p1 TRINITY_DN5243_c0_g1~~TRINITY_DN5243_c0_g1_i1.p1  ORF type:complete len:372 (+),score=93.46 TRINITY_DN5243_c0_g1_i1:113-1228(+)
MARPSDDSAILDTWITGLDEKWKENSLVDGILGCIYGQAIGDAIGLATEFLTKERVEEKFGVGPIPFPSFVRGLHSGCWEEGDWTDDTDQMILIMEGIIQNKRVEPKDFAKRLYDWIEHGFPELGDKRGLGLGGTVAKVVSSKGYLEDPAKAAKSVWNNNGKNLAANGALMRTSILGCYRYDDLKEVAANTKAICKATHYDARCVHNCLMMTRILAIVLQLRSKMEKSSDFKLDLNESNEIVKRCMKESFSLLKRRVPESSKKEMEPYILLDSSSESLVKLELGKENIGYTLNCLAAGLWGFASERDFKTTMNELIMEGGDADTNGAVCGALLGAKIGYSNLPKDWLMGLRHKKWLDAKVKSYLEVSGVIE